MRRCGCKGNSDLEGNQKALSLTVRYILWQRLRCVLLLNQSSLKLERKQRGFRPLQPSFPILSQKEAVPPCNIDDQVVFSKQPNETEV